MEMEPEHGFEFEQSSKRDADARNGAARPHSVTLRDRKHLYITGVDEITSFDETCVSLDVADAQLNIEGSGMKIDAFSNENGDVTITGWIDSVVYVGKANAPGRRGIFKRMFAYDES